jgi:hypothetical protein
MITYIFGLPIYVGSFTDPTRAIKELEFCKNNKKVIEETDEKIILGGVQEKDEGILFDLRNYKDQTPYINDEIEKHTHFFMKELNIQDLDLTINVCRDKKCLRLCSDYWFNIYSKGDHTSSHWHLSDPADGTFCQPVETMFSFNYFAKYDPNTHAAFYFENPSPMHVFYEEIEDKVPEFKKSIKLEIKEGQIIIFPSCLSHYVERHQVDDTRITLSGNLYKVVDGKK